MEAINTKSTYTWVKNFQSVVDNGRNQAVIMDLPEGKGGEDTGPTALEFLMMSLSGCIGTIYALIASKMRLKLNKLVVELEADKGPDDPSIKAVSAKVIVKSENPEEKLQKCLNTTMNQCPVGVLYKNANVPIDITLVKE